MHSQNGYPAAIENHIIRSLPEVDYERIRPQLQFVHLNHNQVLQEVDERIESVYFPNHAIVSLIAQDASGQSLEVGLVGPEGVVGLSTALGVEESYFRSLVQLPNTGLQMSARVFRDEFKRGGALQDLVLRYAHSLILHTSQLAVCNRLHSLSERLARWLLMSLDRCKCVELPFTHEFLSLMLGVRRAGVTEAAIILQTEGCIEYRRGHITIRDLEYLQAHACECYPILKAEFNSQTSTQDLNEFALRH